jgi:hypothetical protein
MESRGTRRSLLVALVGGALAAATAGCGGRTSLDAPDAEASTPAACTTWGLRPGSSPVDITPASEWSEVMSVFAEGDEVFIATAGNMTGEGALNDMYSRVRVVAGDLSYVGPAQDVGIPYVQFIASGFGHRAATGFDPAAHTAGCMFVALDDDGSALGPPAMIGDACHALVATPSGFAALGIRVGAAPDYDQEVWLLDLDPSGVVVDERSLHLHVAYSRTVGLTRFDDGSLFVVWDADEDFRGQRFSEDGSPFSDSGPLPGTRWAKVASLGTAVLLADDGLLDDSQLPERSLLWFRRVDEDLQPGLEASVRSTGLVGPFDVALAPGGALAVWLDEDPESVLMAQPLTAEGALAGERIRLEDENIGRTTRMQLVGTPDGALLLTGHTIGWGGIPNAGPFPVVARALCYR